MAQPLPRFPKADVLHRDSPASAPQTPQDEQPPHAVKYVHVDAANASAPNPTVMKCQLPGHRPLEFPSYGEYDIHYQKTHMNRCSECDKNFPSELILNLHLAEIHNPINEARKARGEKIYACFAEGCDKVCSEPHKRRMHMVSKHHFPKDYDFTIIKDGIDGRNSMLRSSRHDVYTLQPRQKRAEKPKAKAEGKKVAKSHVIFDEDGKTPMNLNAETTPKEDAMDIVGPTNKDPPDAIPNQDVEMETDESSRTDGLAMSKHATDPPRSDRDKSSQKKGKQRKDQRKGKHGEELSGSTSTGPSNVSSKDPKDSADDPMEGLTASMSSLKFVPPSIRFGRGGRGGRGRGRGGFARS